MSDDVLDLLETAPAPPMSIDPYAAVLGGRRRLRTRRAGVVGAGLVAAALVVAVGTQLPVLGRGAPAPAATPGLTAGVPGPAATLESGRGLYHVRLEPRADDPLHVAYLSVAADGTETELGGTSLTRLGDELTYGRAEAGDVILGVLPADATNVSAFLGADTDPNQETTWAPLPGTAYRAFAIGIRPPQTTDDLWFLMWTDRDGRHRTTAPADQRSAVFTVPATDEDLVLWGDPAKGVWGLTGALLHTDHRNTGSPTIHLVDRPGTESNPGWSGIYGLLPAGARDVEVTVPPGRRLDGEVQWQALEVLDTTAFLAVVDGGELGRTGGWVPRVTWTNADGSPGSFTP